MTSHRYDSHYRLLLWPAVFTTLITACFYGLQSLRRSLRLVTVIPILITLTTAYFYDIPSL